MNVRTALPVGAFVVVTLTGVWFGAAWFEKRRLARASAIATAANDEIARTTPILDAAPAPLPTALPVVGPEGVDAEGFPRAAVDKAALRSLLTHKQFAALSGYITELVDAFEKDDKYEAWESDAFEAFRSAEGRVGDELDAWVASEPTSFAARLARARHWVKVGFARRGVGWANETTPTELAGMRDAFERARSDVDAALRERPRLLPAFVLRIEMASSDGDRAALLRARDAGIAACPPCTAARAAYLASITPRWGGSYEEMDAFARASQKAASTKAMRSLLGAADADRADVALRDKRLDEAEALITRALATGEGSSNLILRARIRLERGDEAGALADLERTRDRGTTATHVLAWRAGLFSKLGRFEDGARDLLESLRIDATDDIARAFYDFVRQGLVKQGYDAYRAGRRDDALRMFDVAAELAPNSADVSKWRTQVILGKDPPDPGTLERALDAHPDDFHLRQQLDYVLARTRAFSRILPLWDAYLKKHPDDRRAYVERAGTNVNLRRLADAKADALKACELGSNEGCALAKRLGAR